LLGIAEGIPFLLCHVQTFIEVVGEDGELWVVVEDGSGLEILEEVVVTEREAC